MACNGTPLDLSFSIHNESRNGDVAINRPIETPMTGGENNFLVSERNCRIEKVEEADFLSASFSNDCIPGNKTDRPKLQKNGLHPTKNKLMLA
jgi:hypothetical protein